MYANSDWIESSFHRRECVKVVPSQKDARLCCCGLSVSSHPKPLLSVPSVSPRQDSDLPENWNPSRHTVPHPTDAYGCIDFQGGPHPNKAQYVRLAHDSKPDLVLSLLIQEWGLELPKLVISIHGGKQNFDLQPKLKKALGKGLLKAAKTTGAWILTGGTNTGVTRHVGDALITERSPRLRSGRVVSIGIGPWGVIENRQDLVQKNKDVPYHSIVHPSSRFAVLNNLHSYFLLVDNGTVGKYGAEIAVRRKIEKHISLQRMNASQSRKFPYWTHCSTPVVCLIIEGGTNTIRSVLEYVTSSPPVPVVVCDGTGRAADLLAFAHRYIGEDGDLGHLQDFHEELLNKIQKTFKVDVEQAEQLLQEIHQCVRKKSLITVFRSSDEFNKDDSGCELDQTILTALFKAEHLSPAEQLTLALTWNRDDIARSEIFKYGVEWDPQILEQAMMDALINDRVAFVKLLLENGVNMSHFLTMQRLEDLYNCKQGPQNTLKYLVKDVVPRMPQGYVYTLIDIGLVVNHLLGGGYKSVYTRRGFRNLYALSNSPGKVSKHNPSINKTLVQSATSRSFNLGSVKIKSENDATQGEQLNPFDKPFSDLFIWAVLTKRQDMALLMWQHGEEAIAKSLVACSLYNAMAYEAEDDDLDVEIYNELMQYSETFYKHAIDVLDFCYKLDDDLTKQLLTASLVNWSRQTCLSLAALANHRQFLAHPLSQTILGDLWMGGLRMRRNPTFKIALGILFPPAIFNHLEFKTKEELELMPQTEEEYVHEKGDGDSGSHSSSHGSMEDIESLNGASNYYKQRSDSAKAEDVGYDYFTINCPEVETSLPLLDAARRKTRPLRWKKKFYEFYAAPITKFYSHAMTYILFMSLYTYTCLVRTPELPEWPELFVTAYMVTSLLEEGRKIGAMEPTELNQKLKVWFNNSYWNPCDVVFILTYLLGFGLRFDASTRAWGRVIYCTVINYFFIRILKLLSVNKYFGPVVTMMSKMIKNMSYFVVLLLVVLVSFGVCRQSILYPNEAPDWYLLRHVFYQPYFMLYGEVYAPDIDPECNPDCTEYGQCGESMDGTLKVPCHPGRFITPIVMTLYLLIANIVLINLLIAVFNNIYQMVNAISHEVWNFQRFAVVMEYEEKPVLPPPLIIFSLIHRLARMLYRKLSGGYTNLESGLKLFLGKYDLERLYDFEEECVEGHMLNLESQHLQTTNERVKNTLESTEQILQNVEDVSNRFATARLEAQSTELRLRHLEELCEKTVSSLAVIHRFMSTHIEGLELNQDEGTYDAGLPQKRSEQKLSPEGMDEDDLGRNLDDRPTRFSFKNYKAKSSLASDISPGTSPTRKTSTIHSGSAAAKVRSKLNYPMTSGFDIKPNLYSSTRRRHRNTTDPSEISLRSDISEEIDEINNEEMTQQMQLKRFENDTATDDNPQGTVTFPPEWQRTISQCLSESNNSAIQNLADPKIISVLKNRQHLVTSRDYTSITDELEIKIPVAINVADDEMHPGVKIEADTLIDAEETSYNIFQNLISRRLRRESHNLHSSLEDLITRSIREDSSSESIPEAEKKESKRKKSKKEILKRSQSKIKTKRTKDKRKHTESKDESSLSSQSDQSIKSPPVQFEMDKDQQEMAEGLLSNKESSPPASQEASQSILVSHLPNKLANGSYLANQSVSFEENAIKDNSKADKTRHVSYPN